MHSTNPQAIHSRLGVTRERGIPGDAATPLLQRLAGLLLVSALCACAARAPYTAVMAPYRELPEETVQRLIGVWQQQVNRYIAQAGAGDPAVLLQTQALRSRDVLRPAQVTFGVLNVEASVPDRDGWDVQGVFIGRYADGPHNWSVFLVGIIARERYRPASIQDIRLVTFAQQGGELARGHQLDWEQSRADPRAVQRYRDQQPMSAAVRFPADKDRFEMNASGGGLWVREARSEADWSLRPGETSDARVDRDVIARSGRS